MITKLQEVNDLLQISSVYDIPPSKYMNRMVITMILLATQGVLYDRNWWEGIKSITRSPLLLLLPDPFFFMPLLVPLDHLLPSSSPSHPCHSSDDHHHHPTPDEDPLKRIYWRTVSQTWGRKEDRHHRHHYHKHHKEVSTWGRHTLLFSPASHLHLKISHLYLKVNKRSRWCVQPQDSHLWQELCVIYRKEDKKRKNSSQTVVHITIIIIIFEVNQREKQNKSIPCSSSVTNMKSLASCYPSCCCWNAFWYPVSLLVVLEEEEASGRYPDIASWLLLS